jgi:hypothetical protein
MSPCLQSGASTNAVKGFSDDAGREILHCVQNDIGGDFCKAQRVHYPATLVRSLSSW